MRVLVLGATGHYGRMICERLAPIHGIKIIAGGRDEQKLSALGTQLDIEHVEAVVGDDRLSNVFASNEINVVIDAVGPFQDRDTSVIKSCIAGGVRCYLDIADTREFFNRVWMEDYNAKSKGFIAITGLGLSAVNCAILDAMATQFSRIDRISMGFSGDGTVPGMASILSSLSTCGQPIDHVEGGRHSVFTGLHGLNYRYFANGFAKRSLVIAEIPEIDDITARYGPNTLRFQRGLGALGQKPISFLANLTKYNLMRGGLSLAPFIQKIGSMVSGFSAGRGAIFIDVEGKDLRERAHDATLEMQFKNAGNEILIAPVVAIVQKLLANFVPECGAYTASSRSVVSLSDILKVLDQESTRIHTHGLN